MVAEVRSNFVEDEVGAQERSRNNGEDDPESPEPESYVVHTVTPITGFQHLSAKIV